MAVPQQHSKQFLHRDRYSNDVNTRGGHGRPSMVTSSATPTHLATATGHRRSRSGNEPPAQVAATPQGFGARPRSLSGPPSAHKVHFDAARSCHSLKDCSNHEHFRRNGFEVVEYFVEGSAPRIPNHRQLEPSQGLLKLQAYASPLPPLTKEYLKLLSKEQRAADRAPGVKAAQEVRVYSTYEVDTTPVTPVSTPVLVYATEPVSVDDPETNLSQYLANCVMPSWPFPLETGREQERRPREAFDKPERALQTCIENPNWRREMRQCKSCRSQSDISPGCSYADFADIALRNAEGVSIPSGDLTSGSSSSNPQATKLFRFKVLARTWSSFEA